MRGRGICYAIATAISIFGSIAQIQAHPDVWVTMSHELIFTTGGLIAEVHSTWTYDRMSSAAALQSRGLIERAGHFTPDELAGLAADTIAALKPYGFFTFARANGESLSFADPIEGWLEFNESVLTLHAKLRFTHAVDSRVFTLELFDENSFMDFSFRESGPVSLVNAPDKCKIMVAKPSDAASQRDLLGEAYLSLRVQPKGWDAQFSNKVSVQCP